MGLQSFTMCKLQFDLCFLLGMSETGVVGRHLMELDGRYLFILSGDFWPLHCLVMLSGPSSLQFFPPLEGGGLVHVLLSVSTPPPQVFEHSP